MKNNVYFTHKEFALIAYGLQCLSYMMDNGTVTYSVGETEQTVNDRIDAIANKIAEAEGFGDLTSDEDCAEECEEEELNTFGVDCDNCLNTICGHNFCKVYSVPTSFKKGSGYCKYFTKET